MIYRIKFVSDEVDTDFYREFKIDSEASFDDLAQAILAACNYEWTQCMFYTCDNEWEHQEQISTADFVDETDTEHDVYIMEKTPLSQFVDDEGQRFEFVFDIVNERSFFLQVKELIPGQSLECAELTAEQGTPPEQYIAIKEDPIVSAKAAAKVGAVDDYDLDEDFYGASGGFSDDELDLEGMEFTDGL